MLRHLIMNSFTRDPNTIPTTYCSLIVWFGTEQVKDPLLLKIRSPGCVPNHTVPLSTVRTVCTDDQTPIQYHPRGFFGIPADWDTAACFTSVLAFSCFYPTNHKLVHYRVKIAVPVRV